MHNRESEKVPILGVNYCLPNELGNEKVFSIKPKYGSAAYECQRFKKWMESHYKVRVHTWDSVDYSSDEVKAAVYLDNTFRYFLNDKMLRKIPYEKRALVLEEPSNANPFFYFVPWGRNSFKTIFTHSTQLLKKQASYIEINVRVGGEPSEYVNRKYGYKAFEDKKLLVAVSSNVSSPIPWTSYRARHNAYEYFSANFKDEFDLYGRGWDGVGLDAYRGQIEGTYDDKIAKMANYRFAICYENNVHEPGYISEKIFDCFCARCVPVYYGSHGVDRRIPKECFIDRREFDNLRELGSFLLSMTKDQYMAYIDAIEKFLRSEEIRFFSSEHFYDTIAKAFNLHPIVR